MNAIIFQNPKMLFLLPVVLLLVVFYRVKMRHRRRDVMAFGEFTRGRKNDHRSAEPLRLGLLILAVICLVLALMRPVTNPHPKLIEREGRDLVFLLDVSNSMLAEDRLPNRLESAKQAVEECAAELDGHRIGLVAFAGSTSIVCPLTTDKDFFLDSLKSAGSGSVAHGGTRLGDAILKVCDKLFVEKGSGYRDLILLTDGGDHSEGVQLAVDQLDEKNVNLLIVGLGDSQQGARIPLDGESSEYVIYEDEVVWSRLDSGQLEKLAKSVHQGAYLEVGTRRMDLAAIYQRLSEQQGSKQLAEEDVTDYDELFHWFVGIGLFLLLWMAMTPHSWQRARRATPSVVLLLLAGSISPAEADTLADEAFTAMRFTEAAELYSEELKVRDNAEVYYKLANTLYLAGKPTEAIEHYLESLQRQPAGGLIVDVTYNLGNAYYKASRQAEDGYTALDHVNQSLLMYRRVLMRDANHRKAAINTELVRLERRELIEKLKLEEARQKAFKAELIEIREDLLALIAKQRVVIAATKNHREDKQPKPEAIQQLTKEETIIATGAGAVAQRIEEASEKFFKQIPLSVSPLFSSLSHSLQARSHAQTSVTLLDGEVAKALERECLALASLESALAALPRDPSGAKKPGGEGEQAAKPGDEGEENESEGDGDDGDGEGENESGEEGNLAAMEMLKLDLNSIELPPPSDSPQDVMKKAAVMQEARQAKGGGQKSKGVKKNW